MSGVKRYIANFRKHSKNGPYDEIIEKEIVLSSGYDALLKKLDESRLSLNDLSMRYGSQQDLIQSLQQQLSESIPVFELQNWIMICGNLTDEQDEILTKFISFIQNYKPKGE